MVIHELTSTQCRDVLARARYGRLGCTRNDQPYVVPIFFYLDAEASCLYSFSTVGQKIVWMRENPQVCVEVDDVTDQSHWTTVVALGRYEELADTSEHGVARQRAVELFNQRPHWWLPGIGKLVSGHEHHLPVIYRIHIVKMTGRRADRPSA